MKKQKIKMATERVITIILICALVFGTELSGVFALDMRTGESAETESVPIDEDEKEASDKSDAEPEESVQEEADPVPEETQEAVSEQRASDADSVESVTDNYVGGVIWLDENEDGVMDADEPVIRDYPVTLYQDDQVVETTKTDVDGSYRFENLEAGEYVIEVQAETIDGKEYLIPLCGIDNDNMFEMTEKADEEVVALSDPVRVAVDTRIDDMNAGMREPMDIVATSDGIYLVATDDGELKDGYNSLEEAVKACPDGTACTITVTQDDEINAVVEIPADKKITLKSETTESTWTITQTATTTGTSSDYSARHFYVQGSLTLDNIILAGTGDTTSGTYNGGVYVSGSDAEFKMVDGAVIEQCSNYWGGGVYVVSSSTFEMESGSISENESMTWGGGIYASEGSRFKMTGGKISGNEANDGGGGICAYYGNAAELIGGEISGNEANDGGGVYSVRGTLKMTGGSIEDNEADNGGGVYVSTDGVFKLEEGEIGGNIADNGGGVYVSSRATGFELTDGSVTGNTASDGGGIYTEDYSYIDPASTSAYANITIDGSAEVKGNSASVRYSRPGNYDDFKKFPGELLNNDDINYKGTYPVYLITYDANNDTEESYYQEENGNVSVTLLTESEANFTKPSGYILTGWNTKADGSGTGYDLGATITIDSSLTLYAVWETDTYVVITESGISVGKYSTLAEAVGACLTTEPCVITATQDDEIDEVVMIPDKAKITLTSSADGPWMITQTATTTSIIIYSNQFYAGRHFYVEGSLTLNSIALTGTENTASYTYNGGVQVSNGGSLYMMGDAVIKQCSNYWGGGVLVNEYSRFVMEDGKIKGNKADFGGGVYGYNGATFEMAGGEISGNEAADGGGVAIDRTFKMTGGEIRENEAGYGGGVYVPGSASFEMSDGLITGNTATDGGGIYTADYSYTNPASKSAYANISISSSAKVTGNTASAKYVIPENYAEFEDFPGELLNNNEINYKGYYLVTYDANNGEEESFTQNASSGTGDVLIKLLEDRPENFTEPDGYVLVGWNTEDDGSGDSYGLGETITINDSLTLYAVWEEPGVYIVTTEEEGTLIGKYPTLAKAVAACSTTEACVITATQDDEIDTMVEIPDTKTITLTSSSEKPWTITQTATTTGGSSDYSARHFYVQGTLTLDKIFLSGTGDTASGEYNGGVYVSGSNAKLNMEKDAVITQCSNSYGGGVYVSSGAFEMIGGEIRRNEASFGGGLYVFDSMSEMAGGNISGNEASEGGGVYAYNSTFRMINGEIGKNDSARDGGGVYIDLGEFTMVGGEISNNGANEYGGGVSVWRSVFTIEKGLIMNNTAGEGGGLYVFDSTFEMTGGEVSGNEATWGWGGGVCVDNSSTFEMTGGEVSGNQAIECGGGVDVNATCTFKMTGGEISGNEAIWGGGVIVNGTFKMTRGEISGNEASYGGGVYGGGTFKMTGGEISGNETSYGGGGVFVDAISTFEMAGGEISGNEASYGGGVYVYDSKYSFYKGTFNITDGIVTDNTATDGGGIYTDDYDYSNPASTNVYANITISGNAQVTGNTASEKYGLPVNYACFTNFPGELLNNNEINYKGSDPVYIITYDANNSTAESCIQQADSGTGNVAITLLTAGDANFTAPSDHELAGWNTKADGSGDRYDLGETIEIDDSLTLYAVWEQNVYEITERYYSIDGVQIQENTAETVAAGENYEKTAPVLPGYRYLGYQLDGGALHSDTTATIKAVDQGYTVTYVYKEYSETINVSVPVKLLWAAYESDSGDVISPEYYFFNHSTYDINVRLQELTITEGGGLDLVEDITAGSGDTDEVALQLEPMTDRAGWSVTNRVSLLEGDNKDGLLGRIKAGGQGFFDIIGTYGGDFADFDLTAGDYLQPEYEAIFKIELTH